MVALSSCIFFHIDCSTFEHMEQMNTYFFSTSANCTKAGRFKAKMQRNACSEWPSESTLDSFARNYAISFTKKSSAVAKIVALHLTSFSLKLSICLTINVGSTFVKLEALRRAEHVDLTEFRKETSFLHCF